MCACSNPSVRKLINRKDESINVLELRIPNAISSSASPRSGKPLQCVIFHMNFPK